MKELIITFAISFLMFAVPPPVPADTPCAGGTRFSCVIEYGVMLVGDRYAGENGKPIVLLLHMLGRNRKDYAVLIPLLQKKGFEIVAVDLRGHGDSARRIVPEKVKGKPLRTAGTGSTSAGEKLDGTLKRVPKKRAEETEREADMSSGTLSEPAINKTDAPPRLYAKYTYEGFRTEDWARLPDDARTVLAKVTGTNRKRPVYIVGASIGANAAAIAAAQMPSARAIVLLSPGEDYHGLAPEAALKTFEGQVFIASSAEDNQSYSASKKFAAIAPDRTKFQSYHNAGHGTNMFSKELALPGKIADWLAGVK